MQNAPNSFFAKGNIRKIRRRIWRQLLNPLFREVDAKLLDAGQLQVGGIHRILVLRPNHRLGNLILITPLLTELEQAFPGAEIDVLTAGGAARDVLAGFPTVRRILALPQYIARHPLSALKTIWSLHGARYDLAVSPATDSYSSRVLVYLAKARNLIGIPPSDSSGRTNWNRILPTAPEHFAKKPVFMLRHALVSTPGADMPPYPPLNVRLTESEQTEGRQALDAVLAERSVAPGRMVIGVFADASGAKRFDTEWWRLFLNTLAEDHPDYTFMELIPVDGQSRLENRFPSFFSRSIRRFASLAANLDCVVCADGGIMHLASASGVPTVGLFSVTDPLKYAPYGHNDQAYDTRGKSPEQIARGVGEIVETIAGARSGYADPSRPGIGAE